MSDGVLGAPRIYQQSNPKPGKLPGEVSVKVAGRVPGNISDRLSRKVPSKVSVKAPARVSG